MPFLVQTIVNGKTCHAIDYRPARRLVEHLGTETARLRISDSEAAQGLDALVRANFPETIPPSPTDLGGEHF